MPATFTKMNSFKGNFQDFYLYFMHILIVFNTFRKLILKCTLSPFKKYFEILFLQIKIERIKCMSYLEQFYYIFLLSKLFLLSKFTMYSFLIETRTFFVPSDVGLISALETMLMKNAF